ncbi:ankyrin [Mollisia scopiformis]|uniref:Ankyrin n=1 Tax=Mollisia scopiformis TaxID=149040 RepID=A0A194X8D0_MOLSC|nr:ankyrin [Mollisia scopiformis]KUJ16421.1 ankyrin [Mollisia scopiformis]
MDPLSAIGLASSIVQFVQFGLTVAARLQEFSQTEAIPQSLRSISTQLPLLLNALTRIQSSSSLSSLDFDTKCILKGMIAGCMEQVQTVEKMVNEITPRDGESLKQRVKKVFTSLKYDERVWGVERNLQTYVQVLILHHVIEEEVAGERVGVESFFDVREGRVKEFVPREKTIGELEEGLRDVVWGKTKNPTILMVSGEKGTGKTQLVLEYVHQAHELGHFRTVFWIDASSLETLNLGFESIYATIKRSTDGSRQEKIRAVKEFLNDLWHPWLLVLDNYESVTLYNEIMDFLPGQGYGGIILVTHNPSASGLGTVLRVPKFVTAKEQASLDSLLTQEVQRKNVDGVKNLVEQGASPDSLIWGEWPVLHRCALFGLYDAVNFLLAHDANPNPPNVNIGKPITWASSSGSLAVIETLLDHEDKIGLYTTVSDNQRAFNTAASDGHLAIMKTLLLRREINLGSKNQYNETVLQNACKKGHFEIVQFLLEDGAVLMSDHIQGGQALLAAASGNFLEIVKLLCGEGKVNPNTQDEQGTTPLCYAAKSRDGSTYTENGCPEIIDVLLAAKIEDQGQRKMWLERGMRYAVRVDDRATVLKLLKGGAAVDAVEATGNPRGASPLLLAVLQGHVKMAQFLIRQKARQDIADEKGRLPLPVAAEMGYELLVRDLIKAGGDKDLKSGENEDTLLMLAVKGGHEGVVRVLLERGADREEGNKFGDVAMDVAEEKKDKKILALLEDWIET